MSFDLDLRDFERGLNRLERKQLPFAASLALNQTVLDIKGNTERRLTKDLDRPTPFTKRGIFTTRSTKRNLVAEVGFKNIQAKYLRWQQDGGTRYPKGRAIVVPVASVVGFKRNKYGNMTRNAVKRALNDPRNFSGTVKGVAGIWRRPKRGKQRKGANGAKGNNTLTLLAAYRSSARYTSKMDFEGGAYKTAKVRLPHNLQVSFAKAMTTSR